MVRVYYVTDEKGGVRCNFCKEYERVFHHFVIYHMKVLSSRDNGS
jgi:hypothetical protein